MARAKKKADLTAEEKLAAALVPEAEQPYKVPENWCWVRLGSAYDVNPSYDLPPEGEIAFTPMASVPQGLQAYPIFDYGDSKSLSKGYRRYGEGDVAFAKISPCFENRKSMIVHNMPSPVGVGSTELVVLHSTVIDPRFTYLLVVDERFIRDGAQFKGTVGQQRLRKGFVENYAVPLPPLPEQRRIVNRVESLFAKLDEAESKLRDILAQSETRRTAILHDAFSGKLTKAWRDEHGVSSDTWKRMQLGDVLLAKPRNGYSPKPVAHETPYKSLSLSAVTKGVFDPTCFKYVDIDIDERSYLWLEPGDILLQRANSLEKVGTSALYMGESHEFVYPDLMMKLQVKEGISSTFLAYQLKLPMILHHFRANATGTAGNMPKINQKTVCSAPAVMPSLSEQKEIVRRLDTLFAKQDAADARVNGALSAISTLRQTILARALRGELGTNDPTEESPIELLEQLYD